MPFFGRGKNKIANPYTLIDFYKGYVEWSEEKDPIHRGTFVNIVSDFNRIAAEKLFEGKEFYLPNGLGRILIIKSSTNDQKTTQAVIDWETTNKVGKVVYYRNQHSNGYRYKIKWDSGNRVKNVVKYYLIPCRAMKRALAKIIKAKENDYYQIR